MVLPEPDCALLRAAKVVREARSVSLVIVEGILARLWILVDVLGKSEKKYGGKDIKLKSDVSYMLIMEKNVRTSGPLYLTQTLEFLLPCSLEKETSVAEQMKIGIICSVSVLRAVGFSPGNGLRNMMV